jgi:hypothetical protein
MRGHPPFDGTQKTRGAGPFFRTRKTRAVPINWFVVVAVTYSSRDAKSLPDGLRYLAGFLGPPVFGAHSHCTAGGRKSVLECA